MSKRTEVDDTSEDEPVAEMVWNSSGKSLLYHLRAQIGGRETSDVCWVEKRTIYPFWDRVWKFLLLAAAVWVSVHIAILSHDVNILMTKR